jgi:putative ABC transport system permease protein
VQRLFLLEASFMGLVGGAVGVVVGALFAVVSYVLLYGFPLVGRALADASGPLLASGLGSLVASLLVSVVAGLYPAHVAAAMVPAAALRSNV